MKLATVVLVAFTFAGTNASASGITYTVFDSVGPLTISGTMTTDGNGGAIYNILDWSLTVSGEHPFTADPNNSAFILATPILKPGGSSPTRCSTQPRIL